MRTEYIVRIAALCLMFLAGGCAFTIDEVKVNHHFQAPDGALQPATSSNSVEVVAVVDKRQVTRPDFLYNKANGYGQRTRGGYAAEEPVAVIVQRALQDGFKQAGFQTEGSVVRRVQVSIEELDYDIRMGFWTGDVIGHMNGRVVLKDSSTGEVLASDAIFAKATQEKIVLFHPDEMFRRTLDAFVLQTVNSELIRAKLK